jgi:perosamine synthetase
MKLLLTSVIGDHSIYKIDEKGEFLNYFKKLFSCENLSKLGIEYNDDLTDIETDLHKKFYEDIKTRPDFKSIYCELIKNIYSELFPEEDVYIYQTFPSIRIQFRNNVVIPPHCDSDSLGNHPIGEKNFILPITKMYGTNRLFIESSPGKQDFQGIDLEYGDLFYFNGNRCTHFNEKNIESDIRISLDFRVILKNDYLSYLQKTIIYTNPRDNRIPVKLSIGGYYQLCHKEDSIIDYRYSCKNIIAQTKPHFGIEEADACYEYMKGGNFVTEFKKTKELENMICDFTGASYCVMTTSGTSALMLAFMSLGIGPGMEVIVPNYTMIASVNSIRMVGATPILADVDRETGTLTKEIIEHYRTERTKAVLHVSLNNRTNRLSELDVFCKDNSILLIEDAAQSLGCILNGKHIGTYGIIGCFSLSTPKIISTGQGGFLLTNDESTYHKINMIKNFGRKDGGSEIYDIFGMNMKFTDIQAVIGIEQIKKLPSRVRRMREIYNLYYKELGFIMIPPMNNEWIPWFIDVFVENRDSLAEFLNKHNIQTRITYPQIHRTSMYYQTKEYPGSSYFSEKGLFLPSHILLTNDEIQYICSIIKLYFTPYLRSVQQLYPKHIIVKPTNFDSNLYIRSVNTGLGNMLFQIASGLAYAMFNKASLHVLGLNQYSAIEGIPIKDHITRNIKPCNLQPKNENIVSCSNNKEYIFNHPYMENMIFSYYYENWKNFEFIKDDIIRCFSPIETDIEYIFTKYPIVKNPKLCSIHIRMGPDMLSGKQQEQIDREEYIYKNALDHMIEHKKITDCIVFTDNKEYAQKILSSYSIPFYYSNERDYIDIWMMSMIKHNIVSFSTLSWWGAYLNKCPDKYILCLKGFRDDLHYPGWNVLSATI